MALRAQEWNEIDRALAGGEPGARVVAELRRRYPHLSWTRCDATDVTETPFRAYALFDVHLVDGADHCVRITPDLERASGFVVADRGVV